MAVELKRRDRKVHFALIAIMVGSGPRIDKAITITSTYIHTYIYILQARFDNRIEWRLIDRYHDLEDIT
jgi:hypothetical protein